MLVCRLLFDQRSCHQILDRDNALASELAQGVVRRELELCTTPLLEDTLLYMLVGILNST
jgi:hypothetical protein